jgi:hypothetical protein
VACVGNLLGFDLHDRFAPTIYWDFMYCLFILMMATYLLLLFKFLRIFGIMPKAIVSQ